MERLIDNDTVEDILRLENGNYTVIDQKDHLDVLLSIIAFDMQNKHFKITLTVLLQYFQFNSYATPRNIENVKSRQQ